mgnify:FL=1
MRIIFLRHGEAIERGSVDDEQRFLTERGKRDLESNLPALAAYLRSRNNVEIWSSPKIRAIETAQILTSGMENKDIRFKDFIGDGDTEQLKSELEKTGAETVVIVGHQPYLSEWVDELCDSEILFQKGAAAEIEYYPDSDQKGKVLWHFPLKGLKQLARMMGPEVEGNSFRQDLMIKMEQNFNQIAENRNRFLSEPDDVESAHQLRVSIRSFRSLISLGKKYLKPEKYQDYQDQFRQAAAEISTLREIDVIINTWNEHLLDQKLDPSQSVLIQELNRKRNIEKDRVIKIVSKNKYIDRLTKSSDDLIKTIRKSSEQDVPTQIVIDARLDKWYQYILKRMINYNEFNFSYIHPIRLKCKKYRYVSENFYGILDPEHRKRHRDVKQLQTLLGNTCDAIRNQEAILKIIGLRSPALEQEVIAFINYEKEVESNYRKLFDSREWLQQISEKEN